MPRIDGDASELDRVEKGRQVSANHSQVRRATLSLDFLGANCFRRFAGVLLEERRSGHTIGEPLHNQWTVCHHRKYERRDDGVVAHQVALRELVLREEDLAEIGDVHGYAGSHLEPCLPTLGLYLVQLRDDALEWEALRGSLC